jgi:hypothetical protein
MASAMAWASWMLSVRGKGFHPLLPHPYMKGKPRTIGELKPGTILLYRMDPKKARVSFYLTPQEVATLDIYLDKECYHSLMDACESAKRKRLLTFNEVF